MLMKLEEMRRTGGGVELDEREKLLDAKLQKLQEHEMKAGPFPPSMHFFKAKPLIERSPIFSLLQKMPKGVIVEFR